MPFPVNGASLRPFSGEPENRRHRRSRIYRPQTNLTPKKHNPYIFPTAVRFRRFQKKIMK
jgi:hypothetical protein